ncbi:hypothetical protein GHT46_20760 [Citrobacter freundii]|uniref:hypothetical protein n=1 Tax=Citrobacter freundii TaxID=546 RepID=UPI0019003C38|nr:hypothetical protein [Citrobacter freundii]MBJ9351432.1 hypothetical protein [Citrobacter freundii]
MKITPVHFEILSRVSALGPHEVVQSSVLPHISEETVNFAISDLAGAGLINAVKSKSKDGTWLATEITSKGRHYLKDPE